MAGNLFPNPGWSDEPAADANISPTSLPRDSLDGCGPNSADRLSGFLSVSDGSARASGSAVRVSAGGFITAKSQQYEG